MSRTENAMQFLESQGWGGAEVRPLAGDASNRRYDRLHNSDGTTAVLMDAPPDKGEDVRPFVRIADWLIAQGLSAPRIFAKHEAQGFLLIEDLGDRLFAREMVKHPEQQTPLYAAAVDALVRIQQATPPDLARYDAAVTVPLAGRAFDWYQVGAGGQNKGKELFSKLLFDIVSKFDAALDVIIQRDFHAENLLWLPERSGVSRVGLLDFQDAMLGHRAYDLVSIIQDARRDVPAEMAEMMRQRYLDATGVDPVEFNEAFAVFGLQRNLRILGGFARLCLRDGKAHYVDLIPRVWSYIQTNLNHPATASLRPLLTDALPAPNEAILNELKRNCGSWSGR